MTTEQTVIIADILGLTADGIAALPEDIKAEMNLIAENSAPETSEDRLKTYLALEDCWRRAVEKDEKELSEEEFERIMNDG